MSNMFGINPHIPPFECDKDTSTVSRRWIKWVANLESFFDAAGTVSRTCKLGHLKVFGGMRLQEILVSLEPPHDEQNDGSNGSNGSNGCNGSNESNSSNGCKDNCKGNPYKDAITRLNGYFNPQRNHMIERFKFRNMVQNHRETIDQFTMRLRIGAEYCDFQRIDEEICGQLIQKCLSDELRREFLKERPVDGHVNLNRLLEIARSSDMVDEECKRAKDWKKQSEHKDKTVIKHKTTQLKKISKSNCGRCGLKAHAGYCLLPNQNHKAIRAGGPGPRKIPHVTK